MRNELAKKAPNYETPEIQYSPMNNTNLARTNYPEPIYHLNNDNVDLSSPQMDQLMK